MIQPDALHEGPQANLSRDSQLEDFQGLLLNSDSDESEDIMFPAEDVILAMTQSTSHSEISNDVLEPIDPDQVFDASPEGSSVGSVIESSPEAISETASETSSETVSETVSETALDASPETVADAAVSNVVDQMEKQLPALGTMIGAYDKVSRKELVSLLEGFVNVLKDDTDESSEADSGREYKLELVNKTKSVEATQIDDRTAEIESLRNLVIEAQDTIIKLLTDRVEDRAKIATLETQVKLLPDLQGQADRAMAAAVKTEEYRTELTKIKFEMDRFRLFRVRTEEAQGGSLWMRIRRWFMPKASREAAGE